MPGETAVPESKLVILPGPCSLPEFFPAYPQSMLNIQNSLLYSVQKLPPAKPGK